jgi:hypothetical protein
MNASIVPRPGELASGHLRVALNRLKFEPEEERHLRELLERPAQTPPTQAPAEQSSFDFGEGVSQLTRGAWEAKRCRDLGIIPLTRAELRRRRLEREDLKSWRRP